MRSGMPEKRRKFDAEFREGAVRLVHETGKPIAQIARDLGIHEGTLGNWVARDRDTRNRTGGELSRDDVAELRRLRAENAVLRMRPTVRRGSTGTWSRRAGGWVRTPSRTRCAARVCSAANPNGAGV